MSETNGKRFNKEEYLRKKAERDRDRPAQWVANPDTGAEFYLRRVGAVGYAISGALPHNMTNDAITAWKASGLEVGESTVDPEKYQAAQRNVDLIAKVVHDACVDPKIPDELSPLEMNDSDVLFIFRWATGQIGSVPLKGGAEVKIEDLQTFSEQSSEQLGVGDSSPELQPAGQ